MSFLKTTVRSIYAPDFYATLPRKSFGSSLGYFLLLVLLLAVVRFATVAGDLLTVSDKVAAAADVLASSYPRDLVVSVNGGRVSTNVREPYFIRMPSQFAEDGGPANLVVIDTGTPFSSATFNGYNSVAWITEDAVVVEGRTMDLSSFDDVTLDPPTIDQIAAAVSPWLRWIGPALAIGAAAGIYALYLLRLAYLLALGLVIWLLAAIFKWGFGYAESYKVGLHAMTLALLVELAVSLTQSSTGFEGFPFMFTLVTLVTLTLNMMAARGDGAQ